MNLETLGSVAEGAAKGAAMGGVLGPIGAGVGASIGVAIQLVPQLSRWIFGEKGDATAALVTNILEKVTGETDPVRQAELVKNPVVAAVAAEQLTSVAVEQEIAYQQALMERMQAEIAERQAIRDQNELYRGAGSWLQYMTPLVSLILLFAWFATMVANYYGANPIGTDDAATLRNLAIGAAVYWVGSSAGSASKDRLLLSTNPNGK